MPFSRLSTAKVAKRIGVHPNTVRLYERLGFIAPVPRTRAGYRVFTEAHVDQMRMARIGLHTGWPGKNIRRSVLALVRKTATGDYGGALEMAYRHLVTVQAERAQAESAARLLQRWAQGAAADTTSQPLHINAVAKLLDLSTDVLRNWERNGLIDVPRDPHNAYRIYTQAEIGRLRVIRMLRMAGYSTMALLRMLSQLDRGESTDVRQSLDTPRPDEDVYTAADFWLTTLNDQEKRANEMIALIEEMIEKQQAGE